MYQINLTCTLPSGKQYDKSTMSVILMAVIKGYSKFIICIINLSSI